MSLEQLQALLGWSIIINMGLLLWWFFMLTVFREQIYRLHNHWFPMSQDDFTQLHYAAMAGFKLAIVVLNLSPYIALRIIQPIAA